MRLPVIQGLIRRRLLLNYRIDPDVAQSLLPSPLRPRLQKGFAVGGICLIRLEDVRPAGLPGPLALASENAAHRFAVEWDDARGHPQQGVYVARRDTGSRLNALGGGRLFPGEQRLARFDVEDDGRAVALAARARDGGMVVEVLGKATDAWPADSCFASLAASSAFFEKGSVGYSATHDGDRLDGMRLETQEWEARPFTVERLRSSYFDDETRFPPGSLAFDHALVMRDLRHEWHAVDGITVGSTGIVPQTG